MKYEVTLKEIEIYVLEVEAVTDDDAKKIAYSMIESEEGKQMYHQDSDGEAEAYEINE